MIDKQLRLTGLDQKLIVDLFAGGGGMSVAMEMAWGRSPDIAINHNEDALSLHQANHPQTEHYVADVYEVCPKKATHGRPVGWLHLSPDCTHFSQAKGGQPRNAKIRALAWIAPRWCGQKRPDWISLENVKQFVKWGPLIAKRCPKTGRVVKLDGTIAEPGERTSIQEQFLVPDPKREGQTYRRWRSILIRMGYDLQSSNIVAANQGGHTTRERHFEVGNCVGEPILWDEPTHHKQPQRGQQKWKPAADCIDWSIPYPSIFERKRPLAEATMRRIARGIQRYVLESADPFIVPVTHQGADRVHDIREPFRTITAANRGELMLATPTLVQAAHGEGKPGGVQRWGSGARDVADPIGTVTASGGHAVACAYLMQANGGFNTTPGHDLRQPMSTVTNSGSQQQLVTAHLAHLRGNCDARDVTEPLRTISAGGEHHGIVTAHLTEFRTGATGTDVRTPIKTITAGGHPKRDSTGNVHGIVTAVLTSYYTSDRDRCADPRDPLATITTEPRFGVVECTLSPEQTEGAERVAAFMMRFYSEGGQWSDLRDPMTTVTTKDRMALVTVTIKGTPYVIVDIGLRMLSPRELFRAQDFPDSYIIDRGHDGRKFSKSTQVRMVGNSVNPTMAVGFLSLNAPHLAVQRKVA